MPRPSAVFAPLICLAALLVGCTPGGDTSMYVRNDSAQTWYVRVQRAVDEVWVVRVDPGANGFAVSWDGGRSVPVELLDLNCTKVGTFTATVEDAYQVEAVPGLAGTIKDSGGPFGSRSTTPGISDTHDCGGMPRA